MENLGRVNLRERADLRERVSIEEMIQEEILKFDAVFGFAPSTSLPDAAFEDAVTEIHFSFGRQEGV